jgi:shikimate dehydrogenase
MQTFGLIGYPLSHSFSKNFFDKKFEEENLNDHYFENYSISDIDQLHDILKNPTLKGLAVTIPHKRSVIDFLYQSDPVVKKIGACNCIKIRDGKLTGYNTDVIGFEKSFIKKLQAQHQQALILGTGGASAAVEFVLQKLHIPYQLVSRNKKNNSLSYDDLNEALIHQYPIIINTSPVGMYPHIDEAPLIPYQFITPAHYLYDLIYNPAETKFLKEGKLKNATIENGYDMLVLQAEENWKIWNS